MTGIPTVIGRIPAVNAAPVRQMMVGHRVPTLASTPWLSARTRPLDGSNCTYPTGPDARRPPAEAFCIHWSAHICRCACALVSMSGCGG